LATPGSSNAAPGTSMLRNSWRGTWLTIARPLAGFLSADPLYHDGGELAVIIGRGGRHIAVERALEHVAGYTCFVDGSVRDYQKFSVTSGKNFPATGPLGPWIVTTDEIADPKRLTLVTRLNGQEVQK